MKAVERGTTLLGTYQVLEGPFGGAMGRVFRVRHLEWDVDLAMKQPGKTSAGRRRIPSQFYSGMRGLD